MASLIEELVSILEQENGIYEALIPIAEQKTKVIINNDLEALQSITAKEQEVVDRITSLERKRAEVIVNIGTVLSTDPGSLSLKELIRLLKRQEEKREPDGKERYSKQLAGLRDSLLALATRLQEINGQNKILIEQSLEMIDFNVNFLQSSRMAAGAGYTKEATETGTSGAQPGMFDKKQ